MDQTISGTVYIIEDNIFEANEEIQLQLSLPTNTQAELGAVSSTTITIEDNEGTHSFG